MHSRDLQHPHAHVTVEELSLLLGIEQHTYTFVWNLGHLFGNQEYGTCTSINFIIVYEGVRLVPAPIWLFGSNR